MTEGKGASGRDVVLESRHVVGLFAVVVVLCGVFFALGYLMGKMQTGPGLQADQSQSPSPTDTTVPGILELQTRDSERKAAASFPPPATASPPRAPSPGRTPSATAKMPPSQPPAKTVPKPAPVPAKSVLKPPQFARGSIVLQVAALVNEKDALAMAQALQEKEFPAFVLAPQDDKFYRIQVGPYADLKAAQLARRALEREGFKAILRR